MDLSTFRKEYSSRGLHRAEMAADPMVQFAQWFQQAVDCAVHEPNAMSLATVDAAQCPLLRTVLLKYFDAAGFVFFTNYESRKAQDIAGNPQVSLLFPWLTLERQVIVQGRAEKIATAESLRYFASRPRDSQIGAWVSQQSAVISSRALLRQKWQEVVQKFQQGDVPLPSFWGGYRVVPQRIEFWQGGAARLHDRICYEREVGTGDAADSSVRSPSWQMLRLNP